MRKIKLFLYAPLLFLMLAVPYFISRSEEQPPLQAAPVAAAPAPAPDSLTTSGKMAAAGTTAEARLKTPEKPRSGVSRKELVSYALSLLGKPYTWGGTTAKGFDCSGFTTHVFQTFGIKVSRSSSLQADDGKPVSREEARPGDLVIFTGTNPEVRNPGHVGIVISAPGGTISFVHSSSVGGVKVSKVEGTRYNTRFLQIRRVL